jgi:serine/threonine protein kinase
MTATMPPVTQAQFGASFRESAPLPSMPLPEPRPAESAPGTAAGTDLTIDETDSPWLPNGDESDDEGPLRLTLARAPAGQGNDGSWQPLADRVRLASGKRVPGTRYKIVRWLGEGGMGMVFEAVHVDIQRSVALKILKPGVAGSGLQRERFLEEARAVASVDSRFVVDVLDFGELPDGRPFYTMELLDPVSLYDELRAGPMALERALPILRQCCKALAAIHERGMAHRDVKPQNVLIQREDGRTDAVRIVDFGIASKFCSQPRIAGTAMYMAPEQIRGVSFDGRLDVYALGCVAYELLTGAPPFEGASAAEVVQHHLHGEVVPPSSRLATLPPILDTILLNCLAKEPEQRYANMHELEAALCEVQIAVGFTTAWDDLPLPALTDTQRSALRQRMPQPAARERRRLGPRLRLVAAAFVVGLVSAMALTSLDSRSDDSRNQFDLAVQAITEKTEAARIAASRAYWAYPPVTEPDYPTALRVIGVLEHEDGAMRYVARARANELREEFAATLVRLGDQYWSAPNGRPFAVEFYAQALLFDQSQTRARERASLTPAQVADVASRATTGELSQVEVETGEVLRALADPDPEVRRTRVEALLADGSSLNDMTRFRAQLSTLVGVEDPQLANESQPAVLEPEAPTPKRGSKSTDTSKALPYVQRAKAALAQGNRAQAEHYYEKALDYAPKLGAAHAGLAEIHFARGRYQEAMAAARRAVRSLPNDADLQLLLGDACVKTLRYTDARGAYKKAQSLGHDKAAERLAQLDGVKR